VVSVIRYNETDVKVLQEMLSYLRQHMISRKRATDTPANSTRSKRQRI